MIERPILFSGGMVRAILEDRKAKTRRIVKPQPTITPLDDGRYDAAWGGRFALGCSTPGECLSPWSPFGQPGDRLWVRESGWEQPERTPRMMREGADTWPRFAYDADGWSDEDHADFKRWGFKRRPSIHMPRWASRILLEIVSVSVERLNDISEDDAIAEGIGCTKQPGSGIDLYLDYSTYAFGAASAIHSFKTLWDQINGPGSWAANPWVWVIEFKRVTP